MAALTASCIDLNIQGNGAYSVEAAHEKRENVSR